MMKLRILEIIGDPSLAGAPRHLLGLLDNFDYRQFEIFVISPPGPLAGEIRSLRKPLELEIVKMSSKFNFKTISEIRKKIKHLKPDVIHIHGTRAGSLGRLAAIGLKIPVIYTEHLWTKNYKLTSRVANLIQLVALWFLDMFTNANIAVSQAVKDFMVESQISRPEKITVIYNGIEMPETKAKPFSSEEITLGTVGTLNQQKGIQYLIQALPMVIGEFPKTKLIIVGEGDYKSELEKLVKKIKLQKVVSFSGFVKEIEKEMKEFDIYIQPSLSESFGLAIVHAMSLGLPVVATNTGGIPEVVTTGKSGILIERESPKALANGILKLLRDKTMAKEMGHLGREEAEIKFNLREMVKEVEEVYEKMAETGT